MPYKLPKKKKYYKYNDIKQIEKWSIKKRIKNNDNINPQIFINMSLEGMEDYNIHPQIEDN